MVLGVKTRVISFIWGISEATFFFFVPDIWLSYIAIHSTKEAYINIIITTLGALVGGVIMYLLGVYAFDFFKNLLPYIPAISAGMVADVGVDIENHSLLYAMQSGSFSGIPYKIYALWAGYFHFNIITFIIASIIVRALRFTLVSAFAHTLRMILTPYMEQKSIIRLHVVLWVCFYFWFFYVMVEI